MEIRIQAVLHPFEGFRSGIAQQGPLPIQLLFKLSLDVRERGTHSDILSGEMLLSGAGLEAKRWCTVFGGHVHSFARALQSLHAGRARRAELMDWERSSLLRFTALRELGEPILLSGDWDIVTYANLSLDEDEAYCARHCWRGGPRAGLFVVFQGLGVERQQIPSIVADFGRLLEETGVGLELPW